MTQGRVLITGATGFVGRSLVQDLGRRGLPLTAAIRAEGAAASSDGVRRVVVGEIGPSTAWDAALEGVETVIHLAAHVHVAPERALREASLFDAVNHLGSVRLFEAAARRGVRRFVFMSSITVLGGSTAPGRPFDATSAACPETPYARSKHDAELALSAAAAGSPTSLVILRPPLVCGPGVKGNLGSLIRLASLPVPLPLGRIRNRRTLISLDNLVCAIRTVTEGEPRGNGPETYLLGDREPVSTSGIVAALRQGLGRRALLLPAPQSLMQLGATLLGRPDAARRLLGNLEVDAAAFRTAYGWDDVTDTVSALRLAGIEAARRG